MKEFTPNDIPDEFWNVIAIAKQDYAYRDYSFNFSREQDGDEKYIDVGFRSSTQPTQLAKTCHYV